MLVFRVEYAKCPFCDKFTSMTWGVCFNRCEHYDTIVREEKEGEPFMKFVQFIEGGSYMEEWVEVRHKTVVLNLEK